MLKTAILLLVISSCLFPIAMGVGNFFIILVPMSACVVLFGKYILNRFEEQQDKVVGSCLSHDQMWHLYKKTRYGDTEYKLY
jgi:Ca2+/Na+ antiporter